MDQKLLNDLQEEKVCSTDLPSYKLFLAGLPSSAGKADVVMAMQEQYRQVPLRDVRIPKQHNLGFAYIEINSCEGYELLLKGRFVAIKGRSVLMKPFEKGSNLERFKNEVNRRRLYVY